MGHKASRARGGARLAGRAGRLPARGSPGPALWGSAAEAPAHCTLRPLPDDPAGPRGARASSGGASGSGARPVSARARGAEDGGPAPPGPGPGGRTGREPRELAPRSAPQGLQPRGPRGPWAAAGLEPVPRAWGRGRCNPVPLFLQLKAWGSDCSKGGPGRTQVSASPAPPPSLVGRGRGGTPCPPPLLPPWIWQPLALQGAGEALRPRPQLIGGSRRRPPSRTPQEYLLPSDSSPCCCSARPFGSQGGAQREPGPSRPHLAFGSMVSGAPWRVP